MKKSTLFLWRKFVLTLLLSPLNFEEKVCLYIEKIARFPLDWQDKVL